MIHSGAVVGSGLSLGKSTFLGFDTSWSKIKQFRNDKEKRDFIACGAAAGVAAAFGAPLGGVMFCLEEGASWWHPDLTWRTLFCAMTAAFLADLFLSGIKTHDWGASTHLASSRSAFQNLARVRCSITRRGRCLVSLLWVCSGGCLVRESMRATR